MRNQPGPRSATALEQLEWPRRGASLTRVQSRDYASSSTLERSYGGAGDAVRFVRVGSLDEPDRLPPDIHIFTASKQPWVVLPEGTPAVPEFYDIKATWPAESLARRAALRAKSS